MFSDCTQLGLQTHRYISTTNVFHGTTVTVTCEKNYSLINGTSKHTCTDGLWSGKMGQCKRGEANYNSFWPEYFSQLIMMGIFGLSKYTLPFLNAECRP